MKEKNKVSAEMCENVRERQIFHCDGVKRENVDTRTGQRELESTKFKAAVVCSPQLGILKNKTKQKQ